VLVRGKNLKSSSELICDVPKVNKPRIALFSAFSLLLVLCSLLFLSCRSPFTPPDFNEKIPPGMGAVQLTISGFNSRTILPVHTTIDNFNEFRLEFHQSGILIDDSYVWGGTQLTDTIYLAPGSYDLTVKGYIDVDLSAQVIIPGVQVVADQLTPVEAVLKPIMELSLSNQGTFSWRIDFPADLATASINIKPLNDQFGTPEQTFYFIGGTPPATIAEKNNMLDPVPLNVGYYQVVFSFSKSGMLTTGRRDILHVYLNLDSHFDYTFTDSHFNMITHTVTFDYNGANGFDVPAQVTYTDGQTADRPIDPVKTANAYLHLGTHTEMGFHFGGWYSTNNFAVGTEWDFATEITEDVTLYAKWDGAIDVSDRAGTNNVEKALDYIRAYPTAGEYSLYIAEYFDVAPQDEFFYINLTIKPLSPLTTATLQLTSEGLLFSMAYSTLTLENIILKGIGANGWHLPVYLGESTLIMKGTSEISGSDYYDVWGDCNSSVHLSGETITGNITLEIYLLFGNEFVSNVHLDNWTGSIERLDVFLNMLDFSEIDGKQLLYGITSEADIKKFPLGNFIDGMENVIQPISPNYAIDLGGVLVRTGTTGTLTFSFNPEDVQVTDTGLIIYHSDPSASITFNVEIPNPNYYTIIEWYYNNILLNDTGSLEYQPSITLSSSDSRYNMLGPKFLTVEVKKVEPQPVGPDIEKWFSHTFEFTVAP